MQIFWRVAFTQEEGPGGFIDLCCCFMGKNPQIQQTITTRVLGETDKPVSSGGVLQIYTNVSVIANLPEITWTNHEFCFRLYWLVIFLLLYGIWGLFPVEEGEMSLIYLAAH